MSENDKAWLASLIIVFGVGCFIGALINEAGFTVRGVMDKGLVAWTGAVRVP